jgi:hypothetical protein
MPEFRLSRLRTNGVSCDADGAFVGAIPLLNRLQKGDKDAWHPRESEELSEQISGLYGLPIDMSSKTGGLKAIANALNKGDVARAQIATVLLGIPNVPPPSKDARPRERMIKLIRDLEWSGLLKWDSDEHPRWPAGTPDDKGGKKGGKFAPKGEGGGTGAPATEAAANAAAATRHSTSIAHSSTSLADGEHENIWQTFGSYLSHETKSALAQIGQAEIAESNNNFTTALAERDAIAQALKDYADYRARLWRDSHGRTVEIPATDISNPTAGPAELMIRLTAHEPLTRPATNADWIAPLINLASVGAMGAGVPFRFAGPTVEALGEIAAPVAESDVLIGNSGFRSIDEFTDAVTAKYQALYDDGYAATMKKVEQGLLPNEPLVIGNRTDLFARTGLRDWLANVEGIDEGPGQIIRVNRRLYDPVGSGSYRVPDVHIPESQTILDGSLQFKTGSMSQINDYKAFSSGARITIIRPSRAPSDIVAGSYGIVH